ncbi:DUF4245 domain-containing protein [Corynebacterium sp. MC-17D]|uniref:DUF4245 domain-containing protein n=1 Tax=Corynebacterium lipophilum TaxID=2804918 RepID=A0AAW5HX69_9CORY|nr:DUF4245 domain-containing protein [Corynebacterium lipophilum]MCO6394137.1 DUF4245 domain-containing protein [Corynebacterium lipophilum]MCZ2116486.1 DUF4245 domain-containing protein [Corynebacterium lipophilum]
MAQENKPRIFQDGRDMLINVILIVVVMIIAVGATGLCTFNPGKPENGPVQEVDAKTFLGLEARGVDFPVRYPQMPTGWVTNSARRSMIAQQPAPVVGWVTPDGGFIQLTQTGADSKTVQSEVDGKQRTLDRQDTIDGYSIEIFKGTEAKTRPLWVIDAGDARFAVTGAGTDAEFEELIRTALATEPLSAQ